MAGVVAMRHDRRPAEVAGPVPAASARPLALMSVPQPHAASPTAGLRVRPEARPLPLLHESHARRRHARRVPSCRSAPAILSAARPPARSPALAHAQGTLRATSPVECVCAAAGLLRGLRAMPQR